MVQKKKNIRLSRHGADAGPCDPVPRQSMGLLDKKSLKISGIK